MSERIWGLTGRHTKTYEGERMKTVGREEHE